jgi:hypothetical protein
METVNPAGNPTVTNVRITGDPREPTKPEDFQRFEDLARKLVRVPKAEVDEKRQKA